MVDLDAWVYYGLLVDGASGLLYVALGAFVAMVRPRSRTTIAVAIFAIAFGAGAFARNILDATLGVTVIDYVWDAVILNSVSAVALVAVGLWFPGPLSQDEPRLRSMAGAAAGTIFLWDRVATFASISGDMDVPRFIRNTSFAAMGAAFTMLLALLALRARCAKGPSAARVRRDSVLVSAAMIPPFGLEGGVVLAYYRPGLDLGGLLSIASIPLVSFFVAALWARNATRGEGPDSRAARNMALLPIASVLAGLLFARATDPDYAGDLGILGLARTVSVLILVYAILRHRLFDIDVKIKWTLKQSTVAGIFIAVFFVASETAQQFFSERAGPIVGILAAGALVFAIHPLQRVAEKLSDKAMPNVHAPQDAAELAERKRAAYREALALAWADGVLNEREAAHLSQLREVLALGADEYEKLERERLAVGVGR